MHVRSAREVVYAEGWAILLADVLWSIVELAIARLRFGRLAIGDAVLNDGNAANEFSSTEFSSTRGLLVQRIGYVMPRVARRLPWRSDCLIQALAARRWLSASGMDSVIRIGARKSDENGFEAHAWLTVGDTVVTGWDIEGFERFAEFPIASAGQSGT